MSKQDISYQNRLIGGRETSLDDTIRVPSFGDIEQAALELETVLVKTPLLESSRLNQATGGRLLVKAETLQPTGSFKIRGALNKISRRRPEEEKQGLLALSSGNHGLAVAWSAKRAGVDRVVILMPLDTPSTKVGRARDLGAEVVFFDRRSADRQALIREWLVREDLLFIPAFDDRFVIAGAGTAALEVANEASASGIEIDDFFAACSGGGLLAGSALAMEALSPATRVWGVEPTGYDDTAQSLDRGERVTVAAKDATICDALLSLTPGEMTFEVNRNRVSGIVRATDDQAKLGMRVAFEEFGLVAEPGGALALGALLSKKQHTVNRTVAVILSGRNVDPGVYASCLKVSNKEGKSA